MEIAGRDILHKLLTLPGERVLVVKRQHWCILVRPIFVNFFILFSIVYLLFFLSSTRLFSFAAFLIIVFSVLTTSLSLVTRLIVNWYYHLYVVTNRKIMEICYAPLFFHTVNDVLLDQVRCTEIDVKIRGIINEILDKGDVVITFDRPTHEEEFVFTNLRNPKEIGHILGDAFALINTNSNQILRSTAIWYQKRNNEEKNGNKGFTFIEDLFPNRYVQLN